MRKNIYKLVDLYRHNKILAVFSVLFLILVVLNPGYAAHIPQYVDWDTIVLLAGMLVITETFKASGFFSLIASVFVTRIRTERTLALFLIMVTALLSMFLTNDITLFIIVPFTLAIRQIIANDTVKLVIFEAMAVNAGSMLSPVGNPQNMFLWNLSSIGFFDFVEMMLLPFLISLSVLMIFAFFVFSGKNIVVNKSLEAYRTFDLKLFATALLLITVFLLTNEYGIHFTGLLIVLVTMFLFYPFVLKISDWTIIVLIIIMFIDFKLLGDIDSVRKYASSLFNGKASTYWSSLMLSQVVSNVPAAIFASGFSSFTKYIAYGVNVGGNGIVIGSLANIIALRLEGSREVWGVFHKYSIPYLLIVSVLVWFSVFVMW